MSTIMRPRAARTMPNLLILVLVVAAGYSCASGVFRKELVFQRDELQQKIEPKFPLKKKKSLVTTTFSEPNVLLAEGSDRMGIGLDVKVSLPGGKKYHGQVEVDGELEYRPEQGELLVVNSRVRQLHLEEVPSRYHDVVRQLVDKIAELYLSSLPVYRLKQDDFKHSLARLMLKSVRVEGGHLVVEIGL